MALPLFRNRATRQWLIEQADLAIAAYSAIPLKGALTPSFTRAGVKNLLDFEGREYQALSGEWCFWHVNRVRNLWGTTTTTLADTANNSMTLTAGTYIFSMGAGTGTATFSGTGGATGTLAASVAGRVSVTKTITAGTLVVTASVADLSNLQVEDRTGASNTTDAMPYVSVGALDYRSTQNPLYYSTPGTAGHYTQANGTATTGANDLDFDVRAAPTVWALGTNRQPIGNFNVVSGTAGWRLLILAANTLRFDAYIGGALRSWAGPSVAANTAATDYRYRVFLNVTTGVVKFYTSTDGSAWTQSGADVAGTAGAIATPTSNLTIGADIAGTGFFMQGGFYDGRVYSGNRESGGTLVADFNPHRDAVTPTGTITSSTTGEVWTLNGASSVIRSAAYHGSMVDGVRCFPYDYSGNPLPTSESATYPQRGHHVESAATNLAFKSNAITTSPWTTIGTPSISQNAVGPNGQANYAWTVTVNAAEYNQLNGIILTAAAYTRSIKIAKTVGAQSAYPIVLVNASATYLAAATIDTTNGVGTIWTAYTGWTVQTSSVRVTSYNDDLWLVELTFLGTATNWAVGYIGLMTTNATKSSGTTGDADVTGASGTHVMCDLQVELGTKASSYIDNTNAATSVTRPADVPSHTGALCGQITSLATSFWRPVGVSGVSRSLALGDGTTINYSDHYIASATATGFSGKVTSLQWDIAASNVYTPGTQSKVAWRMATNSILADKDGTAQIPDTVATVPVSTQLDLGHLAGSYQINGAVGPTYGWIAFKSQSELSVLDH